MSDDRDTPPAQTFRPSRKASRQALGYAVFFLLILSLYWIGFLSFSPEFHDTKRPGSLLGLAVFGTIIFGGFALYSIYVSLQARYEQIALFLDRIHINGIFSTKEIEYSSVEKIKWRLPRSIKLLGQRAKLSINLDLYDDSARLHLIRFFRTVLPEENQAGWPEFCYRNALRIRKRVLEVDKPMEPPKEGQVLLTRSRIDRLCAILLLPVVVMCAHLAWLVGDPKVFFFWVLLAPIWLVLRYLFPKKGFIAHTLSGGPGGKLQTIGLLLVLASCVFMVGARATGFDEDKAFKISVVMLLPAVWAIFKAGRQIDKQRRKKIAEAPAEWERLESGLDNAG